MPNLVAPEIPPTQNLVAPFLSAFIATSQISNKRRQLEDQLMRMQMEDRQKDQQMQMQASNYQSLDAYRRAESEAANVRAVTAQSKAEKVTGLANDAITAQGAFNEITAEPGTENFRKQANVVRSQFPAFFSTPDGQRMWQQTFSNHRAAATEARRSRGALIKDYQDSISKERLSPYYFENPDSWQNLDAQGKITNNPSNAVKKGLPMDDNMAIVSPAKATRWKTFPVDRYTTLQAQHDAYADAINKVITGNEPDPTVNAPSKIKVQAPDGSQYMLPDSQLDEAVKQGYKQVP